MAANSRIHVLNTVPFLGQAALRAATGLALLTCLFVLPALAGPKRCDWHGTKSAGEATYKACIDFAALQGTTITVPKNVTRISTDGISLCTGTVSQQIPGKADIVFIYDNSGSMKWNDSLRVRGKIIKQAVDYLVTNSPASTAGALAFHNYVEFLRPPLLLSVPGNADLVKNSIVLQDDIDTYYAPPLQQARAWLSDTALIKTSKQAIIFISDGQPSDSDAYLDLTELPPVYTIFLAKKAANNLAAEMALGNLARNTGGTYTRVDPMNFKVIEDVMYEIVKAIIKTVPTIPKTVTLLNSSLAPPQTSISTAITRNPDSSHAVRLDSIIGLKTGTNALAINIQREDGATVNYSFTLDASGPEIDATGGRYTCWEMPTLTAVDGAGVTPVDYALDSTGYTLELTRSRSELQRVSIAGTSVTGDKEYIAMGVPISPLGFASQVGDFKYNANAATVIPGNGILEANHSGALGFTWTHPRDPQETVSYTLPGRVAPIIPPRKITVLNGDVFLSIKEPITKGEIFPRVALQNPVVIVDSKNGCLSNCAGTQVFWNSPGIPTWGLNIKSPISYIVHVYDNVGQTITDGQGEISLATWNSLSKSGDSASIQFKLPPIAKNGQQLGSGVYLLKALITSKGDQVTKDSAGDSLIVKNARQEYLKRFGYLRR